MRPLMNSNFVPLLDSTLPWDLCSPAQSLESSVHIVDGADCRVYLKIEQGSVEHQHNGRVEAPSASSPYPRARDRGLRPARRVFRL